jgi:hypothetical protein
MPRRIKNVFFTWYLFTAGKSISWYPLLINRLDNRVIDSNSLFLAGLSVHLLASILPVCKLSTRLAQLLIAISIHDGRDATSWNFTFSLPLSVTNRGAHFSVFGLSDPTLISALPCDGLAYIHTVYFDTCSNCSSSYKIPEDSWAPGCTGRWSLMVEYTFRV